MVCTADNFLSRNFVAPLDRRNIIRHNDSATIGSIAISYWRCGMSKPDKSIDPKILEAAKKEFLEKGYEKASTNVICKNAGVTWGALQKRYEGKDALFCALVSPVAEEFKATLIGANDEFHNLTKEEQEANALHEDTDGNQFIEYIYEHFDVFRLLLCCAGGSSYEHYMEDLVDILEHSTRRFIENTGHEAIINGKKAGKMTVHILISSYLYGLFEPIAHEMKKDEAIEYVNELKYFFDVGWADILKLK